MTPRHHHSCIRLLFAGLLAGGVVGAHASSTSVTINATVVEVQCTAEQRLRIRACASAQENYTVEPLKWIGGTQIGAAGKGMPFPQFEIQNDPQRRVLIKTILY